MQPLSLGEKVLAVREGGMVERVHANMPKHGTYNVAQHSYGVLSLLLLLCPFEPSVRLIKAALWHDVPERWTGDIPRPAKWASPALEAAEKQLEGEILQRLGLLQELTAAEALWLSAVDMLDFWLWTFEQLELGNKNLQILHDKVNKYWEKTADRQPKEVIQFVKEFRFKRLPDCDQLLDRSYV